ncbi:Ribonucleases P/MRP protein subunit pop1 [Recurvomyces mirabilis]|uniref:Ribonucleases P/MRP protein subunit pop1 n=1 Tax=Recurvomyces mirabilis TaxID=574656 RepID=A0AAE1BZ92_9PEZI|nr:Ribonucleases P/MRP protein subunit pop1 [Recurvomyces mirabilis]KAK5153415.1 Ribonucleases P/MRP protein subunit pop1 [Recurvomyces mirabilis]
MAPDRPSQSKGKRQAPQKDKKRKDAPGGDRHDVAKKARFDHGRKARDARTLSTQTTKSFKNGELDVAQFVQAREYEIRALGDGMARSKKALNRRAFQQVPKDLRRRTASHNVKRIPKRLRGRGKREMAEDNTPTVNAKTRKPTRRMRLRLETAKSLRALGSRRKAEKEKATAEKVVVHDPSQEVNHTNPKGGKQANKPVVPKAISKRRKARKPLLATSPVPKAKFRKRQIYKSWLPTHMFHAKRAQMTRPSNPLWRFAVPLTPSAKSYRPTHRASHDRGAVAWDGSYMSTISLDGRQDSLLGVLKALSVSDIDLIGPKRHKWRQGTRSLELLLHEREAPHTPIAPVTIIWCALSSRTDDQLQQPTSPQRNMLIRVHPSAFRQLWEELLRLAKVAKPQVKVADLRFEIGSIEVVGPGATEALLGALWPVTGKVAESESGRSVGGTWTKLAGLTNPAGLPANVMLGFEVQDPRLHHPPRTIKLPKTDSEQQELLETIAAWSVDNAQGPPSIFDGKARRSASSSLPSQKAVNRRKALAPPGQYPGAVASDPKIPILLFASSSANRTSRSKPNTTSWTLLCPWKCVQPIWYSLTYYPLSTGQQARFGGLKEKRQLAFEAGQPWFPADFPGTEAGWEWEMRERREREDAWRRVPKGKRTSFEKVRVCNGKKGEVGVGWACDWERLLAASAKKDLDGNVSVADIDPVVTAADGDESEKPSQTMPGHPATTIPPPMPNGLAQLSPASAQALLASGIIPSHITLSTALIAVRLHLVTRGVPTACARLYRLPSATTNLTLRKQWLALLPTNQKRGRKGPKHALPRLPQDALPYVVQQRLATSLLEPTRAGEDEYPTCPGEEDLVGFVTTGNFDLGQGKGTGIGSLLVQRMMGEVRVDQDEGRLCVVRNSGQGLGRLARWEVV